jgi:hypothetical protein
MTVILNFTKIKLKDCLMVMRRYLKMMLFLLFILCVAVFYMQQPAIPQSLSYHQFADQRTLIGIPNFWNTVSNLAFLLVGLIGIQQLSQNKNMVFRAHQEKIAYWIFFIGAIAISLGSAYYHWAPDNAHLVFDRLPMTLAFMSIISAILNERISTSLSWLLWPLLLMGLASVFYWYAKDDLRLYLFVQFSPMICIPFILMLFPAPYTQAKYLWLCLLFYLLAKILEKTDMEVYRLTHQLISGHVLKHLMAAIGMGFIILYLRKRQLVLNTRCEP